MLGIGFVIFLWWTGDIEFIYGYGLLFFYTVQELTGVPAPFTPLILIFLGLLMWFIITIVYRFLKYKILKKD
jgi:hypothetical protein